MGFRTVVIIVFAILVAVEFFVILRLRKQNEALKTTHNDETVKKKAEIQELNNTIQSLVSTRKTAEEELKDVREELCRSQSTFHDIELINRQKLTDILQNLNDNVKRKRELDAQLDASVAEKNNKVTELDTQFAQVLAALTTHKDELNTLAADLTSLREQHKLATQRQVEVDEGRVMYYTQKDVDLTNTLDSLKLRYPELTDAFAKIEWTEIWQTKFQSMTNDLLKMEKCGIYRIFTKENGEVKSYIGQGKKIRERWSQHIKKMLGIEKPDNNKLYDSVHPYNAHFEIVEECKESELNEKEHYWIDFYNCIENGYNTRT